MSVDAKHSLLMETPRVPKWTKEYTAAAMAELDRLQIPDLTSDELEELRANVFPEPAGALPFDDGLLPKSTRVDSPSPMDLPKSPGFSSLGSVELRSATSPSDLKKTTSKKPNTPSTQAPKTDKQEQCMMDDCAKNGQLRSYVFKQANGEILQPILCDVCYQIACRMCKADSCVQLRRHCRRLFPLFPPDSFSQPISPLFYQFRQQSNYIQCLWKRVKTQYGCGNRFGIDCRFQRHKCLASKCCQAGTRRVGSCRKCKVCGREPGETNALACIRNRALFTIENCRSWHRQSVCIANQFPYFVWPFVQPFHTRFVHVS